MKTYRPYIITALCVITILVGIWFFSTAGEWRKPTVNFTREIQSIGMNTPIEVVFSDTGSGLRTTTISIIQDNTTHIVSAVEYEGKGVYEKNVVITVDPLSMKLHDGPALLIASAVDRSLWKNTTTESRQITIDTTPPQIHLHNTINNINPGGTCVVVYSLSEPASYSGVKVNSLFFRGYPVTISGKPCHVTFFALPVDTPQSSVSIKVVAADYGGNEASLALPHLIRKKQFRNDRMNLSDTFLSQKMPEFQNYIPSLRGLTLIEIFQYVNGTLREENDRFLKELSSRSHTQQLWEGTFLRMKNAAPMALFGDRRTYEYQGRRVGESIHMGVDLASTANAPVEAANHGIVIYTGYLGIYGNTVVIDHGFGLLSLYGHLSSLNVTSGQQVKKGDVIGATGMTGLAGGDHLHFGIIVGGHFVNPQEWWDPHWIQDNVTKKMALSS